MALSTVQLGVLPGISGVHVCCLPRQCVFPVSCLFLCIPMGIREWSSSSQGITITCCLVASDIHMITKLCANFIILELMPLSLSKVLVCACVIMAHMFPQSARSNSLLGSFSFTTQMPKNSSCLMLFTDCKAP